MPGAPPSGAIAPPSEDAIVRRPTFVAREVGRRNQGLGLIKSQSSIGRSTLHTEHTRLSFQCFLRVHPPSLALALECKIHLIIICMQRK